MTLGEYIPGVFGKKQVEDKLYKITKTHLDDKGNITIIKRSMFKEFY